VTLVQQITALIEEAPVDLQPAIAALAPVLAETAEPLNQLTYWLGCGAEGNWISMTLRHPQTKAEKNAVYGFRSQADLKKFYREPVAAFEIPTIDLLFQLLTLDEIDRLVLFSDQDFSQGRTVDRSDLQQAVQNHLKQVGQALDGEYC
jgi:hypothetical protein